jgi:hypothetical protein
MKLYEVLLEDKKKVQEAPMGMLKTLGNKAMSKLGNARATGKLSTGALANQLHKEFQQYLGKTGREATKDAVMGFLQSKGYPTQGAATIINTALKGAANAPAGPMANMKATARGLVGQAKDAMVKQVGNIADKMKPGLKAAPIDKTEPTMGDETPTTTAPAKTFNNQLGGGNANYSISTGFDPKTMKNTSVPLKSKDKEDKEEKEKVVSSSKINKGNMVAEAGPGVLPQSIIDKAILKAAQEAEIINTKQGQKSSQQAAAGTTAQASAPADDAGDSGDTGGGFGAGLKKGFTGKTKASPDIASLEQRIAAIEKKVGLA